ncbi:hypothetical protein NC652_004846 [Populus alba x Populus x berolinensis]|nr:hypothetical protein NC652_004846 [Populus alba x Populus x berolinensis]
MTQQKSCSGTHVVFDHKQVGLSRGPKQIKPNAHGTPTSELPCLASPSSPLSPCKLNAMYRATVLFMSLCITWQVALSITDDFEYGPKPSEMKGTVVTA